MKKILTAKTIAATLAAVLLSCSSSVLADDEVMCDGKVTVKIANANAKENERKRLLPLQTSGSPTETTDCSTATDKEITFMATDLADDGALNQVNSIGICEDNVLAGDSLL